MESKIDQVIARDTQAAKPVIKEKGNKKDRPVMPRTRPGGFHIISRFCKDIYDRPAVSQMDIFLYRRLVIIVEGIIKGIKIDQNGYDYD